MNKFHTFLGLSLLVTLNLSAQIPDNFNFLNHTRHDVQISDVVQTETDLLAVHEFGVDHVKFDYRLDGEWAGCSENQKFIYVNDSTYHFANWYFNCSDGIISGLRTMTSQNGEISSDNYDASPNKVVDANDITYDTTGGWWCFTDHSYYLHFLKDGKVEKSIEDFWHASKLFTSCSGDIYVLQSNELLHFSGDTLEYDSSFPEVKEVHQDGEYNFLLSGDQLLKYDCHFENQLNEWKLPISVESFRQINFDIEDKVYANSVSSHMYQVYGIDSVSNVLFEYEGMIDADETISGIEVTSDSTHLIYGQHHFELTNHSFYRNIHIDKQLDYPKVDVEISSLYLTYIERDSIYDILLDSMLSPYTIKLDIKVSNLSNDTIYALNAYSSEYREPLQDWYPITRFRYSPSSGLLPLQSIDSNINSWMYYHDIDTLRLELNGANFKFLERGPSILNPDLSSSLIEIMEKEEVVVYPNPASKFITLRKEKIESLKIIDSNGRLCMAKNLGAESLGINVESLVAGMYFVLYQDEEGKIGIGKFIKN